MKYEGMKVLILDIETSPIDAYTWGIWQQNIAISQIKDPTRVLAVGYKWERDKTPTVVSERTHEHDAMIEAAYEVVDEADAIVHYNGTQFDMKHLNREFMLEGYVPPASYKNIDLLRIVKQQFKFPSNKLEYVASALGIGSKLSNPGMQMWIDCLDGDEKAWKMMEKYCAQDVALTQALYDLLQGWIPRHPNRALYVQDQENPICPNCGSTHIVLNGVERPARVNAYQRYRCQDCGAPSRGRKIISKAGPGVLM